MKLFSSTDKTKTHPLRFHTHKNRPDQLSSTAFSDAPRARAHSTGSGNEHYHQATLAATTRSTDQEIARQVAEEVRHEQLRLRSMASESDKQHHQARADSTQPKSLGLLADVASNVEYQKYKSSEKNLINNNDNCDKQETNEQINLVHKKAFNCMLLGARQTGKRTIVKCFVKLLDEFKLASDEFKKEKIISKLVECSERLNELAEQQEQMEQEKAAARRSSHMLLATSGAGRRRSRLNSWFSARGSRLLNLSPSSKRRLRSMAGKLWQQQQQQNNSRSGDSTDHSQLRLDVQQLNQQTMRRHTTTIEHANLLQAQEQTQQQQIQQAPRQNSTRFLDVIQPGGPMLSGCSYKSDTNINYLTTDTNDDFVQSLEVPCPGGNNSQPREKSTMKAVTNHDDLHSRTSTHVSYMNGEDYERGKRTNRRHSRVSVGLDARRRISSAGLGGMNLSKRRKRMLLSLKELNRRKWAVRFNTRRQLSDTLLEQLLSKSEQPNVADIGEQKQPTLAITHAPVPDAFLIVYSINDRDSFEYAQKLIEQIRACQRQGAQNIVQFQEPIPIILVANKIDLQRAREVKTDEAQSLARKHRCKFIEISCTVGFNLDSLLVGLRTQLVLKHHILLNSILRPGFKQKYARFQMGGQNVGRKKDCQKQQEIGSKGDDKLEGRKKWTKNSTSSNENILVRFYKRYVTDNLLQSESDYDCDNFSKL